MGSTVILSYVVIVQQQVIFVVDVSIGIIQNNVDGRIPVPRRTINTGTEVDHFQIEIINRIEPEASLEIAEENGEPPTSTVGRIIAEPRAFIDAEVLRLNSRLAEVRSRQCLELLDLQFVQIPATAFRWRYRLVIESDSDPFASIRAEVRVHLRPIGGCGGSDDLRKIAPTAPGVGT